MTMKIIEQEFLKDLDTQLWKAAEAEVDDGLPFAEKMEKRPNQLKVQFEESDKLEAQIKENLAGLGYNV